MTTIRRIAVVAAMHARELARRRVAVALLVALPLAFYLTSAGGDLQAPVTGGIGMAFSVSGVALFSVMSSRRVDQRLVLGGFRPSELLLARLGVLVPVGTVIAAGFAAVMALVSHPARWWLVLAGLVTVTVQAVPFGLAVGAAVPRELEGTLVLIGTVGVQMATAPSSLVARLLPFYGPRRMIAAGVEPAAAVLPWVALSAAYAVGFFLIAQTLMRRRTRVRRPQQVLGPAPAR